MRLEDPLAEGWYDHDWDQPIELRGILESGLKPGSTVFDVGAHQCVVALMLASRVGSNGLVVAIEGEPHNARVGRLNVARNPGLRVDVVHAAIAARRGAARSR